MDKLKASIPGTSAYKAKKAAAGSTGASSTGDTGPTGTGKGIGTTGNTGATSHMQPATGTEPAQQVDTLQPDTHPKLDSKQREEQELQPDVKPVSSNPAKFEQEELQPKGQHIPQSKAAAEEETLQPQETQHRTAANELQPSSGNPM